LPQHHASRVPSTWGTAKIFGTIKNMKPADPAESRYWSMSAYALGNTAVKFSAIPCDKPQSIYPENPGDNYLSENLSFTPWHSLPEHRPLGNLNRARKKVYEATSRKRHLENNAPRAEPKPN
jgi:hypothetical protein